MTKIVIVESPSKARTLSQYLGKDYEVFSSMGHVRDLPGKPGSVDPDRGFSMTWEIIEKSKKNLDSIVNAAKKASEIILATDLDREGEAIAWHLTQVLQEKNALPHTVKRISFHSVTKEAVTEALKHPRNVNEDLVEAYLARLSLDYLFGFTLSPLLWRKLPGSRSSGRVQSVALRIVVEREEEIEAFKAREYWSISAEFSPLSDKKAAFLGRLTHIDQKKLEKFSLETEADANVIRDDLRDAQFSIKEVEKKRVKRNPSAPFVTSSLQQEASRKLGFSPSRTMRTAQRLYEGVEMEGETIGLITYMRTDSVHLDESAIQECRDYVGHTFGEAYLPDQPRRYKTKQKGAQEAHEAIRPTDVRRTPAQMKGLLEADQLRLYALIWERTVASQMAEALFDQTIVDIAADKRDAIFRATGMTLAFNGFLVLYRESEDDAEDENQQQFPALAVGEDVGVQSISSNRHVTEPPPRYSEASLIKRMVELGIGRPSTYAHILSVLQERNYVRQEKKRLIPEELGRIVTLFLKIFFPRYVDYTFTSTMEEDLDEVSSGKREWKALIEAFWKPFSEAVDKMKDVPMTDVFAALEEAMFAQHSAEKRTCPKCGEGALVLRMGKFGPFLSCSRYPECKTAIPLSVFISGERPKEDDRVLGKDPGTQEDILVKKGPYGWYLEWSTEKKRVSIPREFSPHAIELDQAMWLKSLPITLGEHPETHTPLVFGIGRFGPYVKNENTFVSVKGEEDLMAFRLEDAVRVLAESGGKKGARTGVKKSSFSKKKGGASAAKTSKPRISKGDSSKGATASPRKPKK